MSSAKFINPLLSNVFNHKKISGTLFHIWLILIMFGGSAAIAESQLCAGSAKIDITPDIKSSKIPLGGYAARRGKPAAGVHDPVFARTVVLQQGSETVAIVSTDLCFLPACIRDNVIRKLHERGITKITNDHLFLSATHTHCAPDPLAMHTGNSFHMPGWSPFDSKLLDFTSARITDSIETASKSMQTATISSGKTELSAMNHNRRGGPLTDHELTVVSVRDTHNKIIAMIVNFAAHPTLYDDDMMEISADWPGRMCAELEKKFGGSSVALFLNGAEGDASPANTTGNTDAAKVENYGDAMAQAVINLLDSSKLLNNTDLQSWQYSFSLPARKPNGLFLAAAAQLGASIPQARAFVTSLMPQTTSLSFVKIGGILFIGFPCEPTASIGLEAKKMATASGFKTPAVVALTNDWLGYALTAQEYREGSYEAGMSFYGDQLGPTLLTALSTSLSKQHH